MPKILLVEDDPQIIKSLKLNLKLSGHEIEAVSSCQDAWQRIKDQHFDVMFLDIGLPDGSGLDLCHKIREAGDDIPILMMSARTDEASVVKGISNGADDYIRKPFGMDELKARMHKTIKRFSHPAAILSYGPLTIDSVKRIVTFNEQGIALGRKEIDILMLLVKRSGDIVSRESILNALYDNMETYDRTIDSHMSHLRKKLRDVVGSVIEINSVYGMGYRLEIKAAAAS